MDDHLDCLKLKATFLFDMYKYQCFLKKGQKQYIYDELEYLKPEFETVPCFALSLDDHLDCLKLKATFLFDMYKYQCFL